MPESADFNKFVIGIQIDKMGIAEIDKVIDAVDRMNAAGSGKSNAALRSMQEAQRKFEASFRSTMDDLKKAQKSMTEWESRRDRMWDQHDAATAQKEAKKVIDKTTESVKNLGQVTLKAGEIERIFDKINQRMTGTKDKEKKVIDRASGAIADYGNTVKTVSHIEDATIKRLRHSNLYDFYKDKYLGNLNTRKLKDSVDSVSKSIGDVQEKLSRPFKTHAKGFFSLLMRGDVLRTIKEIGRAFEEMSDKAGRSAIANSRIMLDAIKMAEISGDVVERQNMRLSRQMAIGRIMSMGAKGVALDPREALNALVESGVIPKHLIGNTPRAARLIGASGYYERGREFRVAERDPKQIKGLLKAAADIIAGVKNVKLPANLPERLALMFKALKTGEISSTFYTVENDYEEGIVKKIPSSFARALERYFSGKWPTKAAGGKAAVLSTLYDEITTMIAGESFGTGGKSEEYKIQGSLSKYGNPLMGFGSMLVKGGTEFADNIQKLISAYRAGASSTMMASLPYLGAKTRAPDTIDQLAGRRDPTAIDRAAAEAYALTEAVGGAAGFKIKPDVTFEEIASAIREFANLRKIVDHYSKLIKDTLPTGAISGTEHQLSLYGRAVDAWGKAMSIVGTQLTQLYNTAASIEIQSRVKGLDYIPKTVAEQLDMILNSGYLMSMSWDKTPMFGIHGAKELPDFWKMKSRVPNPAKLPPPYGYGGMLQIYKPGELKRVASLINEFGFSRHGGGKGEASRMFQLYKPEELKQIASLVKEFGFGRSGGSIQLYKPGELKQVASLVREFGFGKYKGEKATKPILGDKEIRDAIANIWRLGAPKIGAGLMEKLFAPLRSQYEYALTGLPPERRAGGALQRIPQAVSAKDLNATINFFRQIGYTGIMGGKPSLPPHEAGFIENIKGVGAKLFGSIKWVYDKFSSLGKKAVDASKSFKEQAPGWASRQASGISAGITRYVGGGGTGAPPGGGMGMYGYQPMGSPIDLAARYTRGGFSDVFRRMSQWAIAGAAMYGLVNKFRQLIDVIKEFDDVMGELKKVMKESTDFKRLGMEVFNLSVRFGRTTTETGQIMKVFAQQGLDEKEVLDLTRTALVGVNAANLSAGQSVEFLTSAMRTWNIEADNTIGFIDKIMAVQSKYAITAKELAEGTQILSPAIKAVGGNIDFLLASITGVKEITRQTGKQIANSLKTAVARYTNPAQSALLQSKGISIRKEGGYRNIMDVFGDIANKIKTGELNMGEVFDISKSLGGIRRYVQVLALLNNWDRAMSVMKVSADSYGNSIRANQIHMEKFGTKIVQAGAAWRRFGKSIMDSGLSGILRDMVALAKGLADTLSKITGGGIGKSLMSMLPFALTYMGMRKLGGGILKGGTSKIMDTISRGGEFTTMAWPLPLTEKAMVMAGIPEESVINEKGDFSLRRYQFGPEFEKKYGVNRVAQLAGISNMDKAAADKLIKRLQLNQHARELIIAQQMGPSEVENIAMIRQHSLLLATQQLKTAGVKPSTLVRSEFKAGTQQAGLGAMLSETGAGTITAKTRAMMVFGRVAGTVGRTLSAMIIPMALIASITLLYNLGKKYYKYLTRNHIEMVKNINEEASATKEYVKILSKLDVVNKLPQFGRSTYAIRQAGAPFVSNVIEEMRAGTIQTYGDLKAKFKKAGVKNVTDEMVRQYADTIKNFLVYELNPNYHKLMGLVNKRRPEIMGGFGENYTRYLKLLENVPAYTTEEGTGYTELSKPGTMYYRELLSNTGMFGKVLSSLSDKLNMAINSASGLNETMSALSMAIDVYNKTLEGGKWGGPSAVLEQSPIIKAAIAPILKELYYNANWEKAGIPLAKVGTVFGDLGISKKGGIKDYGPATTRTQRVGNEIYDIVIGILQEKFGAKKLNEIKDLVMGLSQASAVASNSLSTLQEVLGNFKDKVFEIIQGFKYGMEKITTTGKLLGAVGMPYNRKTEQFNLAKQTYLALGTAGIDTQKELAIAKNYGKLLKFYKNKEYNKIREAATPEELNASLRVIAELQKSGGAGFYENIDNLIEANKKKMTGLEHQLLYINEAKKSPIYKSVMEKSGNLMVGTDPAARAELLAQSKIKNDQAKNDLRYKVDMLKIGQYQSISEKEIIRKKEMRELVESRSLDREQEILKLLDSGYSKETNIYRAKLRTFDIETDTLKKKKEQEQAVERIKDNEVIKERIFQEELKYAESIIGIRKSLMNYDVESYRMRKGDSIEQKKVIAGMLLENIYAERLLAKQRLIYELRHQKKTAQEIDAVLKTFNLETNRLIIEQKISSAMEMQANYWDQIRNSASKAKDIIATNLANLSGWKQMLFGDVGKIYTINQEISKLKDQGGPEAQTRIAELESELKTEKLNRPNIFFDMANQLGDMYTQNISKKLVQSIFGEASWLGKMISGVTPHEEMMAVYARQEVFYLQQIANAMVFGGKAGGMSYGGVSYGGVEFPMSGSGETPFIPWEKQKTYNVDYGWGGASEISMLPSTLYIAAARKKYRDEHGGEVSRDGSIWQSVSGAFKKMKKSEKLQLLGNMVGMYGGVAIGSGVAAGRGSTGKYVQAMSSIGTMIGDWALPGAGGLIGGLLGGYLGGQFSPKDLEDSIDKNTWATIQNSNVMEKLESRIFFAPSTFQMPSSSSLTGGQMNASFNITINDARDADKTALAVRNEIDNYMSSLSNSMGNRASIY